jgi:RES domain-containing protein
MELFRLHPAKYPPLDGAGAAKKGGRWNCPGTPVVYCSQSRALCVLEALAHLNSQGFELPDDYALSRIVVPDSIAIENLPQAVGAVAQNLGTAWARALRSAVLRVPSVLVDGEYNYLLNPCHPGFALIRAAATCGFEFDGRLRAVASGAIRELALARG